jgi:hypothetical protein
MSLTNPDIVKNFFIDNVWSFHTFEYIWFWIRMNVFCDDRKISLHEPVSEQSSPADLNDNSPFICDVRRCVFSVSSWDKNKSCFMRQGRLFETPANSALSRCHGLRCPCGYRTHICKTLDIRLDLPFHIIFLLYLCST